jgi:peptide/nickel transport system permease protein
VQGSHGRARSSTLVFGGRANSSNHPEGRSAGRLSLWRAWTGVLAMNRFLRNSARPLSRLIVRAAIVVILGGFLGATLVRVAPGFGVDEEELDSRLNKESIEALRRAHSTDESVPRFYLRYLSGLFHGDLGVSLSLHQPVRQLLAERFPETMKSIGLGLAFAWSAGLALAMIAVMSRWWLVDFVTSLVASILLCVPAAALALLFVIVQAPSRFALGLILFPKIFSYSRNLLAKSASLPHVLTARAKGLDEIRVMFRHVLPVAGPQLLALAGVSVSLAFAATIPVEVLCDLPGIGQLAWKAALSRDLVLLVNVTMIVTLITLIVNSAAEFAGHPV